MKKLTVIFLMVVFSLAACNIRTTDHADTTTNDSPSQLTTADTSESSTTEASEETEPTVLDGNQLPLPQDEVEFCFLSGAGAWRSIMVLNRDGTFTGWYLDSEMGQFGEGYPNGSAYTCTFSGKFENFEKVDAYSYKMTLADIQTEKTVGEEWIENGIRYIATGPHGLNDPDTNQVCEEFVFYLPDTPVEQVPEGFLSWWPYRYPQESGSKTSLSCYGILNVTTEFGFFTSPTAEFADPFAEIMESPDEQPQLSKDEFIEITNHYLSTNKWDLPSEKACFYTYGRQSERS